MVTVLINQLNLWKVSGNSIYCLVGGRRGLGRDADREGEDDGGVLLHGDGVEGLQVAELEIF